MNQIRQDIFKLHSRLQTKLLTGILISLLFGLTACQDIDKIDKADPKTKRKGNNVLTDYIKKPLDKAEGVNKINDARNKRMEDSLKQMDEH